LVVDVVKISNSSYKLSVPAGDLLTAAMNGAVLRRHDLSTAAVPNVLYVPLSEAKLSSGTYTFTFASGDAFTASSEDAYPAAESVSDETGGGSSGGALVVTDTEGTLNKTWQEIHDAGAAIISHSNDANQTSWYIVTGVRSTPSFIVYACQPSVNGKTGEPENDFRRYGSDSADGYPTLV
jgi:hypothetical protein